MIHAERVQELNDRKARAGRYVLYWMQQSQRASFNHALEYAVRTANDLEMPLVVGFGLTDDYPEANERHYSFLLQGLREVDTTLRARNIKFVIKRGSPDRVALRLGRDASVIVTDRGYLRHQRAWRQHVAEQSTCRVVQIEGDVVAPVELVSDKAESAARTIRPKLQALLPRFLVKLEEQKLDKSSIPLDVKGDIDASNPDKALAQLKIDRGVSAATDFRGGAAEARRRLEHFIAHGLKGYGERRRDPNAQAVSKLSPYLHFGQISPVEVAVRVREATEGTKEDREAFLEELIVRRELAANFVYYINDYDKFDALPDWALKTLGEHRHRRRDHVYSRKQFEAADTHDPYWNAMMTEMQKTGYLHNHLRMYWGKKILEWSNTPEYAFRTALCLNNKYFLDGRDASSFANVAWCFGLHDRPWKERAVFGKVRYMNAQGLRRKFDADGYVRRIARLHS